MVYNVTYTDKDVTRAIDKLVGKPYGLLANLKKGGIGSEPFTLLEVSVGLEEFAGELDNMSKCNLELRPSGVIVHFSRKRVNYAWPIPFYQLTLFQNGEVSTVYQNAHFMKIKAKLKGKGAQRFIQKLQDDKGQYLANSQPPF